MTSYTIDEWCALRKISRPQFYVLDSEGKAPETYKVGTRRFVTSDADAAWLRQRIAESNPAPVAA